ncbi:glutathione peroxidase [Promicromonospora soli]|uniref:Glutathione peroxidase n=1 Tax=Promicromonospora soli TaxID=2035533 RepID=A0A919FTU7_9MICO|nr:glutathione peroxidase [Promicromonospora soli]GHH72290.1 glutathione peroxidase [Promicromonospora soli]
MALYDIPFHTMDGTEISLAEHKEDVVLVVNVASRCGLTPQYETLEKLQKTYQDRGFTVLGFPSNQFLQELSSNEKIAEFCSMTYGVTFPVLDKVKVNGRQAHPLYAELTKTADAEGYSGKIRWNFEKFLVLPGGDVRRYAPKTLPDDPAIVNEIEAHLPR